MTRRADLLWQTIESATTDGQLDIDLLTARLSTLSLWKVRTFHRQLGRHLIDLDRQSLHDVYRGRANADVVDPDGFLYWRAGIIASGPEIYGSALRGDTERLDALEECEELLYAASEATGRDISFDEDVETGSNLPHWPMLRGESSERACSVDDDDEELRFHWITLTVEDVTEPPLPPEEQWGEDFHRHPTPDDIDFVAQIARANLAGALTEGLGRASAPRPGLTVLVELDDHAEAPRLELVHNRYDPSFREPGVLVRLRKEQIDALDEAGVGRAFTRVLLDALDLTLPMDSPLRGRLSEMREKHGAR